MKIYTSSWAKVTLGDIAQKLDDCYKGSFIRRLGKDTLSIEHIELNRNIHIKSWGKQLS